jgi:hypothetical protein
MDGVMWNVNAMPELKLVSNALHLNIEKAFNIGIGIPNRYHRRLQRALIGLGLFLHPIDKLSTGVISVRIYISANAAGKGNTTVCSRSMDKTLDKISRNKTRSALLAQDQPLVVRR